MSKDAAQIGKELAARLRAIGAQVKISTDKFRAWATEQQVPDKTHCPVHGQIELTLDVPLSAAEWRRGVHRPVYSRCHECELTARLEAIGVPALLSGCRFHTFQPANDKDAAAVSKVEAFASMCLRGGGRFCVLASPKFGNGKSHLAVAVLAAVNAMNMLWVSNASFMRYMRAWYDGDHSVDVVGRAKGASLLAFDDLGVSVGGKDELPLLHEVFDARYLKELPTVVTTNMAKEAIPNFIGPRMSDRLRQASSVVEITADGMRKKLRSEYGKPK